MSRDEDGVWASRGAPRSSGRHRRAPAQHDFPDLYAPQEPQRGYSQPDEYPSGPQQAYEQQAPQHQAAEPQPGQYPPQQHDGYSPSGYQGGTVWDRDPETGHYGPAWPDPGHTGPHYATPGAHPPGDNDDRRGPYAPPGYPPETWPERDRPDPYRGPGRNGYGPAASPEDLARPGGQNGYRPADSYPAGRNRDPVAEALAPLPDFPAPDRAAGPGGRETQTRQDPAGFGGRPPRRGEPGAGAPGQQRVPDGPGAWDHHADDPGEWDEEADQDGLIPGFTGFRGSGRGRGGRSNRRPIRVLAPVLAPVLVIALVVVLGVGGYKLYKKFQSPNYSGPGTGEVTVQVLPGDTATSLAPRLVRLGVVASVSSFISAANSTSNPAGLEPGFFRLHRHMNSLLAYKLLLSPASRIQSVATIPEGLRMTQILSLLAQRSRQPVSAFVNAAKDTAALGLPSYARGSLEGYLFPATYNFNPGATPLSMLQAMVTRFNLEAASVNLPAAAAAVHLSPGQLITVASLLQAEGGSPKYFALVAEVIYNRLAANWKLGLQSTVDYALHTNKASLTVSQLNVSSPYNTYLHPGLPPGPIDSPGDAAIQAALHPAHGNYMYFVTVNLKTGKTLFTSSQAQFQQYEAECQRNHAC